MRVVQILLAGFMIVVAGACGGLPSISISSSPPTKPAASNKEKIVGTWEFVKGTTKNISPLGSTLEFKADGKVKATPAQLPPVDLNYTLDGDKLKIFPGIPEARIKSLTEKELIVEIQMGAMTETSEYKKK